MIIDHSSLMSGDLVRQTIEANEGRVIDVWWRTHWGQPEPRLWGIGCPMSGVAASDRAVASSLPHTEEDDGRRVGSLSLNKGKVGNV